MDRDRQSEMISAYLDGELTPSERIDAERLLENSPELRDELNDFARLSDLLRALPREEAPAELAAAIRREAERKSLLGAEPSAPRRSYVRELVVAVSAMAATVLGMLLLPQEALHRNLVVSREPMSTAAPQPESRMGWAAKETAAAPMLAAADRIEAAADAASTFEAAPAALAMRATPAAPPPAPKHDADMAEALASNSELAHDAVPIGDVVPYFQNGVGVVVVTVVDVESAGDRLAVLLGNNGLSMLSDDLAKQSKLRDSVDEKPEKSSSRTTGSDQQLMLVYVDATQETVTQVLNEMAAEQLFSHAKLQPPVDAAELDDLAVVSAEERVAAAEKQPTDEALAEKVLTNNAVVATQNYLSRQQLAEDVSREGVARSESAKDNQFGGRRSDAYRAMKGLSNMTRSRGDANPQPGDTPADASLAQNMFTVQLLNQNGAVLQKLDRNSGEVLNNTVMIDQRNLVENTRIAAGDKMKRSAELKKADTNAESEKLAETPAVEQKVRLLVVLQSPMPATGESQP